MVSEEELLRLSCGGDKLNLPFTGERVIPGAVEAQLWKEHVSRYRFASLLVEGKRVLDAGCGAGYGTELLGRAGALTIGFDCAPDAVRFARASYPDATFICGSATAFPFEQKSFQVVTAFEVIEHLAEWNLLISESARVLTSNGIFLVSTPNKEYYAESRGNSGPNPFHIHEFVLPEFEAALRSVFPFLQVLAQNQQEAITFTGESPASSTEVAMAPTDNLAGGHFFLAACSFQPIRLPFFADISSTHNLLREREKHIRGLQGELAVAQAKIDESVVQQQALWAELESVRQAWELSMRTSQEELGDIRLRLDELQREQQLAKGSGWIRLGHKLGVGPWSNHGGGRTHP